TSYVTVGNTGFGGSSNSALFTVILIGSTEREITTSQVMQELDQAARSIAGAEITVSEVQTGFSAGSPIQISIRGENQEVLDELAEQVIWTISTVEGIFQPEKSSSEGNSELN